MHKKLLSAELPGVAFGEASDKWQEALEMVVRDCFARPGDSRARQAILTISFWPLVQRGADSLDANVDFRVALKLPARRTRQRHVVVTRQGEVVVGEEAADNTP